MSNNPYPSLPINDTTSAILYPPRASADDLICSLSPTSSLRGIYVRSRPTSMEVSDREYLGFDFGGFYQTPFNLNRTVQQGDQSADYPLHTDSLSSSSLSNDNTSIFTPTTSESSRVSSDATSVYTDEEYIQNSAARRTAETRARVKVLSEGHALSRTQHCPESISTTASKNTVMTLGLGGHLIRTDDRKEDIEQGGDDLSSSASELIEDESDQARVQKKRTIPLVYGAIAKRVYGVFHRKAYSTPESIILDSRFKDFVSDPSATLIQEPNKPTTEAIKSSSLFAVKRRPTIDSQKEPLFSKNIFSHRVPLIHRKQNSFPNNVALTLTSSSLAFENRTSLRRSSSFACFVDLPELDDELDEATAEATQVARWANVQGRQGCGADDGHVFQRNVQ